MKPPQSPARRGGSRPPSARRPSHHPRGAALLLVLAAIALTGALLVPLTRAFHEELRRTQSLREQAQKRQDERAQMLESR